MATSGNPAKRAAAAKAKADQEPMAPTSAKNWKKAGGTTYDVQLPSGNVVKTKRPSIPELLAQDLLPDSITPKAQAAIEKAQGKKSEVDTTLSMDDMDMSTEGIIELMECFDKVAEMMVVEPKILFHKRPTGENLANGKPAMEDIPDSERDEEIVYTDDIDLEDKLFLFNFAVGGSSDISAFRREFGSALGGVSSGEGMELATVPNIPAD